MSASFISAPFFVRESLFSRKRFATLLATLLVTIALSVMACGGSSADPPPGLWVAEGRSLREEPAPVRVLNFVSGEERELGPEGWYAGPAWSPDGRWLAALRFQNEEEGGDLEAWLFEFAEGAGELLDLRGRQPQGPYWAPDSTRLAMVLEPADPASADLSEIAVFDERGRILGRVPFPDGDEGRGSSSGIAWSPDSQLLAAAMNGRLVVGRRNGTGAVFQAHQYADGGLDFRITCWTDDGLEGAMLMETGGDPPFDEFRYDLAVSEGAAGLELEVSPTGSRFPACLQDLPLPNEETTARVEELAGGETRWLWAQGSADGSADLFLRDGRDGDQLAPYVLVILWKEELFRAEGETTLFFADTRISVVAIEP